MNILHQVEELSAMMLIYLIEQIQMPDDVAQWHSGELLEH